MVNRSCMLACLVGLAPMIGLAAPQPTGRVERMVGGFRVLVDDRLLPGAPDQEAGRAALEFLAAKLAEIQLVVPPDKF